jgi:hypothetical protein
MSSRKIMAASYDKCTVCFEATVTQSVSKRVHASKFRSCILRPLHAQCCDRLTDMGLYLGSSTTQAATASSAAWTRSTRKRPRKVAEDAASCSNTQGFLTADVRTRESAFGKINASSWRYGISSRIFAGFGSCKPHLDIGLGRGRWHILKDVTQLLMTFLKALLAPLRPRLAGLSRRDRMMDMTPGSHFPTSRRRVAKSNPSCSASFNILIASRFLLLPTGVLQT